MSAEEPEWVVSQPGEPTRPVAMGIAMADGGEVEFHGKVVPLVDDAGVPQRLRYRHPGMAKQPGLEVEVEVVDGVPWCTLVALSGTAGSCRVRPTDLKEITGQLDELVDNMLGVAAFVANDRGSGWVRRQDTRQYARPAIRRARKRERRTVTDEHLQHVADIYRKTGAAGRTDAVAKAFKVSGRTAGRYIQRARQAGLLAPTTPGKATDE